MSDELYRRRIRVEGGPDALNGFMLAVRDADTGEEITNVTDIDLHLSATARNTATVTYHEKDEQNNYVLKDGKPVERTGVTANPEVSVTALETMPLIEQLRAEIQMHRDANIGRIMERRERKEASDALKAFSKYADRIEHETNGAQVPVLKLYGDNSGCIRDEKAHIGYFMVFNSIEHLLSQLEDAEEKATASLYGHAHGEPNDG